jgi:hypothetical protein
MTDRYFFEILNRQGHPYILRGKAWSVDEIKADSTISRLLGEYTHRAWTDDGMPLESLPGIPQAGRPA